MKSSRQAVSDALFALLSSISWEWPKGQMPPASQTWGVKGRQLKIWSNVAPADQPAIFMEKISEDAVQDQAYGAPKYLLKYRVWIYLRADAISDESNPNENFYDTVLDAIDAAMNVGKPPFWQSQTLGGLVQHAWIDGQTVLDPGDVDQQIVAMIPISVLSGL